MIFWLGSWVEVFWHHENPLMLLKLYLCLADHFPMRQNSDRFMHKTWDDRIWTSSRIMMSSQPKRVKLDLLWIVDYKGFCHWIGISATGILILAFLGSMELSEVGKGALGNFTTQEYLMFEMDGDSFSDTEFLLKTGLNGVILTVSNKMVIWEKHETEFALVSSNGFECRVFISWENFLHCFFA